MSLFTVNQLGFVLNDITVFEEECVRNERTDTGDVWELLHEIRKRVRDVMREEVESL